MEGVSFYSCKEWGQNGHYNFKTINKGSLVTDKTVAKAPTSPSSSRDPLPKGNENWTLSRKKHPGCGTSFFELWRGREEKEGMRISYGGSLLL